eukprot:9339756-Pyramimonas_sp.AAC.1
MLPLKSLILPPIFRLFALRKQIVAEAKALKAAQEAPQAVETLPTLGTADIPAEVERTESKLATVGPVPVQWNDQRTNGITHVNMLYDLSQVRSVAKNIPNEMFVPDIKPRSRRPAANQPEYTREYTQEYTE